VTAAGGRRLDVAGTERMLIALVAQRAREPGSKWLPRGGWRAGRDHGLLGIQR